MRIRILLILLLAWVSVTGTEYVGTMRMESGYTLEDVRVTIDDAGTIILYRVKFARMMPLRVDVVIPGVEQQDQQLSAEQIIPMVDDKQHPDRMITNLRGTADSRTIDFRCLFGGKEMHYRGKSLPSHPR